MRFVDRAALGATGSTLRMRRTSLAVGTIGRAACAAESATDEEGRSLPHQSG
jgi:hypothetical protein